jgi:hypothetical protein
LRDVLHELIVDAISVNAPPCAPDAAPIAAPASGIKKIIPISVPQNGPETAPLAVVWNSWLSLTRPLGCFHRNDGVAELDQILLLHIGAERATHDIPCA